MNDHEREERVICKLEQVSYRTTRQGDSYLLTTAESITEINTLADLVVFADAVYEHVWAGRRIMPSA